MGGRKHDQIEDISGAKLRKQMLLAGLAGMLADGTMFPMMTVKSRLQVKCSLFEMLGLRSLTGI